MRYFHKQVWLGFITAIAIIAWLAVTSYDNTRKSEKAAKWVAHTNRVLYHSEEILALTIDLESGQRGYALTGLKEFLEPANLSAKQLRDHIKSLKTLTLDNPSQVKRIDELEKYINRKLAFVQRSIDVRNEKGLETAITLNASLEGKKLMDNVRRIIREIQSVEHNLLDDRTSQINERIDDFNTAFVGMLLATGVILITVFYMIYINLKRRTLAERSLRRASETIQDIYDNAPCGYHSLDENGLFVEINNTWLQWLKYQREEVVNKMHFYDLLTEGNAASFHETFSRFKLEGKVSDLLFEVVRKDGSTFIVLLNSVAIYGGDKKFIKTRSTALDYTQQKKSLEKIEQLNHELESFSYSVSHDLRAPLRSIDGYTQILLEDYAHNLDQEGKRVLGVVVSNARRMAKLIDDLLDFSRVGRKEVTKSIVNTEGLVRSVIAEMRALEKPERNIEINVSPLEPCDADANLLRQVWANLISNALKYTRKKDVVLIAISCEKTPSEIIYKISDNGTGFDMQYAHKLFGVFQRLHRQQDFEGTGVGLAIVHRIVTRHGGRVWAEGEAGNGSTFYFSLPI